MKPDELQAIKDRKARELTDYQQKMQTFEQTAQQDLQKMQMELMGPIFTKIKSAVESVEARRVDSASSRTTTRR